MGSTLTRVLWMGVLAASLVGPGCSPGFDDVTEVKDLRILGIQCSSPQELIPLPPEALMTALQTFAPPVTLTESVDVSVTMLIVDPRKESGDVKVRLEACVLGSDRRCNDDYPIVPVADKWVPLGESSFLATLPPELLNAAMEEDTVKGIFGAAVWINGEVSDGETVEPFLKTFILMTDYSGGAQAQNSNPTMDVLAGEEDKEEPLELTDEGVLELETGEEIRFLPTVPEEEHQDFIVFTFTQDQAEPSGGFEEKTEEMTYRFYTTCGSLSTDSKSEQIVIFMEKEDPNEPKDLSVTFTAPDEPEDCIVWFMVEDGRGGVDWYELPVAVK